MQVMEDYTNRWEADQCSNFKLRNGLFLLLSVCEEKYAFRHVNNKCYTIKYLITPTDVETLFSKWQVCSAITFARDGSLNTAPS